jgi:hypothetical protein
VELGGQMEQFLEAASLALGRLDSVSLLLPDTAPFYYSYVRKGALARAHP